MVLWIKLLEGVYFLNCALKISKKRNVSANKKINLLYGASSDVY
jgi:hypothetical protein